MGNIFNKETIITALLEKRLPNDLSHIRGLKDLKTLDFATVSVGEGRKARVCPITQDEFNGLHPFVVLWTTGKVLSEKAVREIGIEGLQPEYGPFVAADVIKLIPLEHELNDMRATMHHKRDAKKSSKRAARQALAGGESDNPLREGTAADAEESKLSSKKRNIGEVQEESKSESVKKSAVSTSASFSSRESVVQKAIGSIEQNAQNSAVFKGLFHKDGEKDKKDRDLFMSVAGIRYTIN